MDEEESWVGLTVKVGTEDGYSRSTCAVGSAEGGDVR